MTTTKRKALHGRTKECLNYIMNPDKTENGTLVSGINCSPNFAYEEMCMINRLYANEGNRVGYHIFQNFNYLDDITPEKAHEIGVQLAKELYPDYQCVVATHTDKAHIHNHICINSINIKTGHKLVDRLNHPEGIANLRVVSDRISRENNLTVIEEAPPIGKYRTRNFLYHYANKNWREQIAYDIESLIEQSENLDHLLDMMMSLGYRVKKGKYVSIKPIGSEKYFRLYRIQKGKYSEDNLRRRIYAKEKISIHTENKVRHMEYKKMKTDKKISDSYRDARTCLLIRQAKYNAVIGKQESIISTHDLKYSQYQQRIYKARKELNQMKSILSSINREKINSFEDLQEKIEFREERNKELLEKIEYKREENYRYQEILPLLKIYTELFSLNELIDEENIINRHSMKHTYQNELKMFEEAKKEISRFFNVRDLNDAKNLQVLSNQVKREYMTLIAESRENIKQLNALYGIKKYAFERDIDKENNSLMIGFTVSSRMIDQERSDDQNYCIRLPYTTDEYIYISRDQTSWIKFGELMQLYFIEEQVFKIYDENDEITEERESKEICNDYDANKEHYRSISIIQKESKV